MMQPRAEEINRVLSAFVQSKRTGDNRRRSFSLVVQGATPLPAEVRELRSTCAMIDVGSSIYTLAYSDILGIDPIAAEEGGLRLTVRPGCFASHLAARLRRSATRSWSGGAPGRPLSSSAAEATAYVREAEPREERVPKARGGIAEGDPAETASAGHEVVGDSAVRTRR